MTSTPDKWIILKFSEPGNVTYKLLAGWNETYLGSASWRLNSGITSVVEAGDYIHVFGFSGNSYYCHKKSYGWTSLTSEIYKTFQDAIATDAKVSMDIIPEETDFLKIQYTL